LAFGASVSHGGGADNDLYVYHFDRSSETLVEIVSINPGGGTLDDIIWTVAWSPDGRYLAAGGDINEDDVYIYDFDRASGTLTQIISLNPGGGGTVETVYSIDWSPDGTYLALGGDIFVSVDAFIYSAMQFPEKNIIKNNTVYCNSGAQFPSGVGISGSSICNMIIQNTAYNNPTNYEFVPNVFNPLFGLGPTLLQNIALGMNPIPQPADIDLTLIQIETLLEFLVTSLL
jgi:WD40 repeat protein